jgi:hypothetical protein
MRTSCRPGWDAAAPGCPAHLRCHPERGVRELLELRCSEKKGGKNKKDGGKHGVARSCAEEEAKKKSIENTR